MRWLLAVMLAGARIAAADPPLPGLPDPTASWKPRDLLPCLIALRRPLDRTPDDQRLLARAQQAYVEFAFGGLPELNGALGPWLGYAEELSARRRALRNGAAPVDLADALPDLWLALVQGDARTAVEGLARWPEAADLPEVRALRLAATRDLGLVAGHPPTTALEWYGYLTACAAQRVDAPLTGDPEIPGVDPLIWRLLANRDPRISVSRVLADIPWLLVPASIPDDVARRHLSALVTAYGGRPDPAATRDELIREASRRLDDFDFTRVEPFIAGMAACRELRTGERGIRPADGPHLLVSVPDMAWWLEDRLYLASVEQIAWAAAQGDHGYPARAAAAFEGAMPGSLIAARTAAGRAGADAVEGMALLAALERELADPAGVSPGVAATAVSFAVRLAGPPAVPGTLRIFRRLHPQGMPRPGIGIGSFVQPFLPWINGEFAPAALAASRRDPFDQRLWEAGRFADPAYALVPPDGARPPLERIDPIVDAGRIPFPAGSRGAGIAATWLGAVRVDAAGPYRFAIDGTGVARLAIGGLVLLHADGPGLVQGEAPLETGWIPLDLSWWSAAEKDGFRLLWRSGEGDWQPVPASRLAHGADHQPGLMAAFEQDIPWLRVRQGVRPADQIRAEAMPWLLGARYYLGRGLLDERRLQEAFDPLRTAWEAGMREDELPCYYLYALAQLDEPGRVGDLLKLFAAQPQLAIDPAIAIDVARKLSLAGLQEEFARLKPDERFARGASGWVFSRMAFATGDLAGALRNLDRAQVGTDRYLSWRIEIESAMLHRLVDGSEPDRELLHDLSLDPRLKPSLRLVLAWYAGDLGWDEALARAGEVVDGDELLWYRGLHERTLGNHALARQLLEQLASAHPDWLETIDAHALLAWYARQTPQTLAALPVAKPLPPVMDLERAAGHF